MPASDRQVHPAQQAPKMGNFPFRKGGVGKMNDIIVLYIYAYMICNMYRYINQDKSGNSSSSFNIAIKFQWKITNLPPKQLLPWEDDVPLP